jgi:hypothetical protein
MPSLDIFSNDAFTLQSLTLAINSMPFQPSRLGSMGLFQDDNISTTSLSIEKIGTTIALVPAAARGAPGKVVTGDKRNMVNINTVHLPQTAVINADEVQNVRAFGSETEVETVQNVVNKRLAKMRRNIDLTLEWQRVGALKGQILDSDGSTVLLDLFTTFGVAQVNQNWALSIDATKVLGLVTALKRAAEDELGGLPMGGLHVMCGDAFFDALVQHPALEKAYLYWQQGQFYQQDNRRGFRIADDVTFENYRGSVGGTAFIGTDNAYAIPMGVPDLFSTTYAPADYMETANTMGQRYYAKQEVMRMNKGVELEAQSNPISICTRPRSIVKLTRT